MRSPSIHVKDKLVAAGEGVFGATSGWNISISKEPPTPDTTITLYDVISEKPDTHQNRALAPLRLDLLTIRVRAGGEDAYRDAYRKAIKIQKTIVAFGAFIVVEPGSADLNIRYKGIFIATDPAWIEQDDRQRDIFTMDFTVKREEILP